MDIPSELRRGWIEWGHRKLSVKRQWELLGVARSSVYYQVAEESEYNVALMRLLDEQYTRTPCIEVDSAEPGMISALQCVLGRL